MTLVEIHPDENDAEFRSAIDALLQTIAPATPKWWHPYELRGTYECRGIRFRHFFCIAGSVELWLWSIASRGGSRRVILMSDDGMNVVGPITMIGRDEEVIIAEDEVRLVPTVGTL